ncbi:glycerophosphodiester phosphodiesterase [Marispirochaeta aestuarii]|nr:glycerophosphodiester phosphodiesterase family protein [Marispirochaeta aestuarii]
MKTRFFPEISRPLLFAHRGCSHRAPENTMPAFELAKKEGIPGIELDVQLSADGELAVFHDEKLERICGVPGSIGDFSMKELQAMEAGAWKGAQYTGSGIPSLRQVLEAFGGSIIFDIEIKYYRFRESLEIPRLLGGLLEETGTLYRAAVSSFDPRIVRTAKRVLPRVPAGLIYDRRSLPSWLPLTAACRYSRADFRKPAANMVGKSVRPGETVLCWTVDSPGEARRCIDAGATGIISNRPEDLFT